MKDIKSIPQNQESSNLDLISWRNRRFKWRENSDEEIAILMKINQN